MKDDKKFYETPELRVYGKVEDITQANQYSGLLDGNYPRGTPSDPGLFS